MARDHRLLSLNYFLLSCLYLTNAALAGPDFGACWNRTQNRTLLVQPENFERYTNRTDFLNYEPGRLYITPKGCEDFCGKGWQLWPANEIGLRIGLFVTPLLVLGLAFSVKPDLSIGTQFFTFIHLVGDPIDSLWSVLTRQEVARRNYAFSAEMVPSVSREVAAILTAYDQWWQDASYHFEGILIERATLMQPHEYTEPAQVHLQYPQLKQETLGRRVHIRLGGGACSGRIRGVTRTSNLTFEEMNEIRRIAQRLAANRSRKWFQTWFSIVFFLVSVCAGYARAVDNYEKRKNSQTAHTLALVCLFAFLIIAVYINGHVGNFDKEAEVLNTINELRNSPVSSLGELFPLPRFRHRPIVTFDEWVEEHRAAGAHSGIINHWHPDKHILTHDLDERPHWNLLLACILAILISWGAALTISYRTPTIGFGCRSVAWTSIMGAWILNLLLDTPCYISAWNNRNRLHVSTRTLWIYSYVRDAIVTLGVIATIIASQLGLMNTCRCRAGLFAGYTTTAVEIGPPTEQMRKEGTQLWFYTATFCVILIFLIVVFAGYEGENGRLLFVRSQAESMAEQRGIRLERRWVLERRSAIAQANTKATSTDDERQMMVPAEPHQDRAHTVPRDQSPRPSSSTQQPSEFDSLMGYHVADTRSISAQSHGYLLGDAGSRNGESSSVYPRFRDV